MLKKEGIEYKGGTSAVTQGMSNDYKLDYKGKSVDIGRHLCIGTARNPELTLRVHFHWDEEDKKLVIHHAGRHLDTRSS